VGGWNEKWYLRSSVDSKELSNGWVMSGKWGPNENSVMTCERFISRGVVSLDVAEEGRTYGYGLHVHSSHNHGRG
jgi:hypothetical protein